MSEESSHRRPVVADERVQLIGGKDPGEVLGEDLVVGHLDRVQEPAATLDHEAMVTAIIAADILEYKQVDQDTWDRLGVAVQRINSTRAMCAPARFRP